MEAMDGREPVSTIQGSRAGIKVLSCALLPYALIVAGAPKPWGSEDQCTGGSFGFFFLIPGLMFVDVDFASVWVLSLCFCLSF